MKVSLSNEQVVLKDDAVIGLPPDKPAPRTYREVVREAMDHPMDKPRLEQHDLSGKDIAVIVDDWGRPTPCGEFLPDVLDRLNAAGAPDSRITIVTASGMHDPMNDERMIAKVGKEAFRRVRCVSHDGGNAHMLRFCGITQLGSPVWVNQWVAEADFKVALGRIFPHSNYGYEGGYKMIVPGVSSFETILRDHSLNFSDYSDYGIVKNNPSRDEADAIGRMVGIDFLVNFVVDYDAKAIKAFAGSPEAVFPAGVDYGQRYVWAAVCGGQPADITVMCHKEMGDLSLSNNPNYYIGLAMSVTRPSGIVISTMAYTPMEHTMLQGYALDDMPFSELIRLHERRDWNMNPREIQHTIKAIRGAFYRRREFEYRPQKLFLVSSEYPRSLLEKWNAEQFPTIQAAYDEAVRRMGKDARVFAIPDAKHTLPLIDYDYQ